MPSLGCQPLAASCQEQGYLPSLMPGAGLPAPASAAPSPLLGPPAVAAARTGGPLASQASWGPWV